MLREDRFRVELHPLHGEFFMPHSHNFFIFGPGGNLQAIRQACALDHQRMIARGGKTIRQIFEYSLSGMVNQRSLAVHELPGAHDFAAIGLADTLVAETNAEDWNAAAKLADG